MSSEKYLEILKIIGHILLIVGLMLLWGLLYSLAWNLVMPKFGLVPLDMFQAQALLALLWGANYVSNIKIGKENDKESGNAN